MRGRGLVVALACAVIGTALAVPFGDAPAAQAQTAPYSVEVPNGGFESPALAAGGQKIRPVAAGWTFVDLSGVVSSTSAVAAGGPAAPAGRQVGLIRKSSKIVQQVWLEPGDSLRFTARQIVPGRTALQTLTVAVDGARRPDVITPGNGTWTTHTVALDITTPRRVHLEIRGLTLDLTGAVVAGALIDSVEILRVPGVIPNAGISARTQRPLMDSKPLVLGGGVVGELYVGDSEPLVNTPVQAFAEAGGRIFVGGKFRDVQKGKGGALVRQSYLAAFDRETGVWVESFRPVFDGTVWDMVVADGKLIVAGQFSQVNGQTTASGLVALDPVTGQVVPGWQADLGYTREAKRPLARALDVSGAWIVVGGMFDTVTGANGVEVAVRNLTRIAVATGAPATGFAPVFDRQVYDVEVQGARVYAVGKFGTVNGESRRGLGVVTIADGASVPGLGQLQFSTPDVPFQYTQAVLPLGASVWVGGSQHHTEVYRASTMTREQSWISDPSGDIQTFATAHGYLYVGSHAGPGTYYYADATANVGLTGWTTRDPIRWIAAIDLSTREVVPAWTPALGTRNSEGTWELFVDSTGCMWAGGDFRRGAFVGPVANYVEGFAKFCAVDGTAPSVPTDLTVTRTPGGPELTWGGSTDDRPGGIRYDVFRNDRMIAQGLTTRSFVDPAGVTGSRYFVRASDKASNRSATTPVAFAPADTTPPKTPQNLTAAVNGRSVVLRWVAPTDNVGVTAYLVYDNPDQIRSVAAPATTVTLTNLAPGTYSFAVRARDAAGNLGNKSAPVDVTIT